MTATVRGNYTIEVDWNNDGDFGDTGEDVTSRVRKVTYERGRDRSSQLTGRFISGKLVVTLDNRSGDYSPFYASSPLYGNLVPKRKVRVRVGDGQAVPVVLDTHVEWTGFVSSIIPSPSLHGNHTAVLTAFGAFTRLDNDKMYLAMQSNILAGDAIDAILDAQGWSAGDRAIDDGGTTFTRFWVDGKRPLDALRDVEFSEGGFLGESKDGKIFYEARQHRLTGDHIVSQATFSDALGAALSYMGLVEEDAGEEIFNIFEASVQIFTVASIAVLFTLAETGAASPAIDPGQSKTFYMRYPNPDSPAQDIGVDAWTTPAATTDYLANSAANGSGSNLTSDIGVSAVKTGNEMAVTLTNNNATTKAYVTFLQGRGTAVQRADPLIIKAEDAASQTKYDHRTWPTHGPFIPTSQEALDWALFNLSIYLDPIPRLRMKFSANKDAAHMQQALLRDVSDRITVVADTRTKLGIGSDFFIEAVHHVIDEEKNHTVEWELSDATQSSDFWVIGTSPLGVSTRLAY